MILPYPARLLCLSVAFFFVIHLLLGLIARVLAPVLLRVASTLDPRRAARCLLVLRLLPPALAVLLVGGLCVPSYVSQEPTTTAEGIDLVWLAAAGLGLLAAAISLTRAGRALAGSIYFLRYCGRSASRTELPGEAMPIWVVDDPSFSAVALAGVLRPRLVISREASAALSQDQLQAAFRHEYEHRASRDNLKRLLLVLAPDLLPFISGWREVERQWAKFTEWAADDAATAGDPARSLSLAAALVSVARLSSTSHASPLIASLVGSGADLAARVDRLLDPAPPAGNPGLRLALLTTGGSLLLSCGAIGLAMQPSVFSFVHDLLERAEFYKGILR